MNTNTRTATVEGELPVAKKQRATEKNFVSAIVYLHNDEKTVLAFFRVLVAELSSHFENFELIAVDDVCTDGTMRLLKEWAKDLVQPLTIVHMSKLQGKELCMNAGIDAAIGDYVYEFDTTEMPYDQALIFDAYRAASEGNDIVSVCPTQMHPMSEWFYRVFNSTSHIAYPLRSAAFRMITRRAINRVQSTSDYMPYRKAAYASSGLKLHNLEFPGKIKRMDGRVSLAVDSLLLYTEAGTKISLTVAVCMFFLTVAFLLYICGVYVMGHPVEGWTTMVFVVSVSFSGVFFLMTIIMKYLSLLTELVFRKQKYLTEGIEKIQK